ncbi:LysM peptidoglycan-binding domain-containing protein [Demequina mangrovi]|uniref:LysM domain-containing protein n=1 Tax=Demequina mangrovi TaxID=1043493 RepID=A0A1H6X8B2_9MICO|nr:LysM domain-containing protein [Demequina mangrovi]SEJ21170.1 hypothetical protein SAMN05421637_1169 [Demequina mangrovi]
MTRHGIMTKGDGGTTGGVGPASGAIGLAAVLAAATLGPLGGALAWHAALSLDARLWEPADLVAVLAGALAALVSAGFLLDVARALGAQLRGRAAPPATGRLARTVAATLAALLLGTGAAHADEPPPAVGWLPSAPTSPRAETAAPAPAVAAKAAAAPGSASASSPGDGTAHVRTVRPGESLWSITADEQGPDASAADIAAAWPELYAANADAIGADPDLIHPGLRLVLPDGLVEDAR